MSALSLQILGNVFVKFNLTKGFHVKNLRIQRKILYNTIKSRKLFFFLKTKAFTFIFYAFYKNYKVKMSILRLYHPYFKSRCQCRALF